MRRIAGGVLVAAALVLALTVPTFAKSVSVQLLAVNDFHGALLPRAGTMGEILGKPAGGVEYLATHLKRAAKDNPNSLVVDSGDVIGGSPLISSLFHDKPALEAFNAMGVKFAAVGNHEFDRGRPALMDSSKLANFSYLSANILDGQTHLNLFPPYKIENIAGVKVGFIGETLRSTPIHASVGTTDNLSFKDEAATANSYAAELKKQGVNTIVLLIHEGGFQYYKAQPNDCKGLRGPITHIVDDLSDDIDVVLSAHTHAYYNCTRNSKLVTSASSFGRMFTRVALDIDSKTGRVTSKKATNEVVTRDVVKDPTLKDLVSRYAKAAAPIADEVVGSIRGDLTRKASSAGESALGDVLADAYLDATKKSGAQIAFLNPTGIRAELIYDQRFFNRTLGELHYADLFDVQPFSNRLITLTLTGKQLLHLLGQQWQTGQVRMLALSHGFSYRYAKKAPWGQHLHSDSVTLNGVKVKDSAEYRVTVPDFLAAGGSGMSTLKEGTERTPGPTDIEAVTQYFRNNSPVTPPELNRVRRSDGRNPSEEQDEDVLGEH